MTSLRTRILLGIALPAIAVLALALAVDHLSYRQKQVVHLDRALATRAASLAALVELEQGYWDLDLPTEAGPAADLFGEVVGYEVRGFPGDTLLATHGTLPKSSELGRDASEKPPSNLPRERPVLVEGSARTVEREGAAPIRVWSGVFYVRHDPEEFDEADAVAGVSGPVLAPGVQPSVSVVLAEDLGPLGAETRQILGFQVAVAVALSMLALLSSWLLSRRIVDPIEAIASAAEAVRVPSADPPLAVSGSGDEIDRLTEALNRSWVRLHEAWERQARFTANASHELRTPLATVRAQAEVALQRERSADEYREALAAVAAGTERLQDTLDGLLLLARADADHFVGEAEPVDLADLAHRIVESTLTGGGATLRVEAEDEVWCRGDDRHLEMLLRNLLSNALRHTPTGYVTVRTRQEEALAVLEVEDTGEGIAPDALPHVFERFFRADRDRTRAKGGAGLGLSIVKVIAEWHGGSVAAASALGRGTTVTVRLPAGGAPTLLE